MTKDDVRACAQTLYQDELQYAIARDDKIDLTHLRARAAMRLGRQMEGGDMSGVWLGYIEGIARPAERGFEIDASSGQLRFEGALRVGDLVFVPAARARASDWHALDARHEQKYQQHRSKREREREAIRAIIDRLHAFGGDPTTAEACPDLFSPSGESEAA